jgi:putative heme-binding domain-containing protein
VDGLSQRLAKATDASMTTLYFSALCRLCKREGDWKGDWWGTRPDTTGPYYKAATWEATSQIQRTLGEFVAKSDANLRPWLINESQRNRADLPNITAEMLKMASSDTGSASAKADNVQMLANLPTLNDDSVKMILGVVQDSKQPANVRVDLIQKLLKSNLPAAKTASFPAVASLGLTNNEGGFRQVRNEFLNAAANPSLMKALVDKAEKGTTAERELAYAVMLKLQQQSKASADVKASVTKIVNAAWTKPDTTAGMLRAIGATGAESLSLQVSQRRKDADDAIRKAAEFAAAELGLDEQDKNKITIATLKYEDVVAAVEKTKGDAALGAKLFIRQGCVNCHTISPSETPKGPFLGGISVKYKRAELCESILKPSAKIAFGFETWVLSLDDGRIVEGFVTKDSGDEVEMRGQNGVAITIVKSTIEQHKKSDVSIMPNGLADKLSTAELASIVAYLESLPAK